MKISRNLDNADLRKVFTGKRRVLNYQEGTRIAKVISDEMASVLAETTRKHFIKRKAEFMALKKKWLEWK